MHPGAMLSVFEHAIVQVYPRRMVLKDVGDDSEGSRDVERRGSLLNNPAVTSEASDGHGPSSWVALAALAALAALGSAQSSCEKLDDALCISKEPSPRPLFSRERDPDRLQHRSAYPAQPSSPRPTCCHMWSREENA